MNTLHISADSNWLVHAAAATILILHILGGTVGIIAGVVALTVRKGGRLHALAGNAFFIAMLVMASIGALVSPFLVSRQGEPKLFDSIAAFFTCYLVTTSWITVKRKAGTIGRAEIAAFVFALLLAAGAISVGNRAANSATGVFGGFDSTGYYGAAGSIALAAALDAKVIINRGITGSPRIARHLWRMCMALFVAVLSFFIGQQRVMPQFMRGSSLLFIPPLVVLATMLFWIVKVRLGKLIRGVGRKLRDRRNASLTGVNHQRSPCIIPLHD